MGQYLCKLGGQRSGPGVNADQVACFFDNDSCGGIGYRKNPVFGLEAFIANIFPEPAGDLLWQEGSLCLFPTFGVRMIAFRSSSIILGPEFQDLTDPHSGSGHEFEQKTIPWILGPEGDFIDHILF